jgi:hypothetical protein
VDEDWKQFAWNMLQTLGIQSLADVPVPGEVFMTAFDVLSWKLYTDHPAVARALYSGPIPDVLARVPHDALLGMWDIVKEHVMDGKTPESYFGMLSRLGKTAAEIEIVRREHDEHWKEAIAWIHDWGGVEARVQAAAQRSLEIIPRLWA